MKVGEWVEVSEDGLWVDCITEATTFKTKKEAIDSVETATLDDARVPRVKRITQGHYKYYPKNCDTGHYDSEYEIIKITPENIEHFKGLEEALEYMEE